MNASPAVPNQHADPADKPSATTKVFVLGNTSYFYNLPAERVHQLPHRMQSVEKLVLCPSYDPANPAGPACKLGHRCRLVHADTRGLTPSTVHVNYAWRALDEVTIPRYPAGETLHVAAPNSRTATDVMDSGCVLATQALQSKRRPLTHCAHYYFNRQCNLGSECRFIHAVFIDPAAGALRRAPAPVQLGRRLRFPEAAKHILGDSGSDQPEHLDGSQPDEPTDGAFAPYPQPHSQPPLHPVGPLQDYAFVPAPAFGGLASPFAVPPSSILMQSANMMHPAFAQAPPPLAPLPALAHPTHNALPAPTNHPLPAPRPRRVRQPQPASTTPLTVNPSISTQQTAPALVSKPHAMPVFTHQPSSHDDAHSYPNPTASTLDTDNHSGRFGPSRRQHLPYSASPVRVPPATAGDS